MTLEFDWVDAFSAKPFGGNGCAVVHGAEDLSDATCMAFVRETGLVECTFLGRSSVADWRVRYFMAHREIPFAGHPTVATAASLHMRGLISGSRVYFETGAGVVPVDVGDGAAPVFTMTQIAPVFGAAAEAALVARVGGLDAEDIVAPPRLVSTGLPFVVTLLRDKQSLRRLTLDETALGALRDATGEQVMEPFWVTLGGETAAGDTFSRLLLAPPLPAEDAFTGSATGAMAAYLWSEGLIDGPDFTAEQGHWMGRPGAAQVSVLGPRDAIEGVRVGGQGHVLMQGTLRL